MLMWLVSLFTDENCLWNNCEVRLELYWLYADVTSSSSLILLIVSDNMKPLTIPVDYTCYVSRRQKASLIYYRKKWGKIIIHFLSSLYWIHILFAGFDVLAAVVMKSSILQDVSLCSLFEDYQHFGVMCCLQLQGWNISQERNQHKAGGK